MSRYRVRVRVEFEANYTVEAESEVLAAQLATDLADEELPIALTIGDRADMKRQWERTMPTWVQQQSGNGVWSGPAVRVDDNGE